MYRFNGTQIDTDGVKLSDTIEDAIYSEDAANALQALEAEHWQIYLSRRNADRSAIVTVYRLDAAEGKRSLPEHFIVALIVKREPDDFRLLAAVRTVGLGNMIVLMRDHLSALAGL